MADVNANIGVNIETSDALNQLKNLQRQISNFHTNVAKSSASAAAAQKALQTNFINSVNAIGAFSAELRTVRTTAETFTNSLEKNKFSMGEYFRYAASQTKTFGRRFSTEMGIIEKTAVERVKTLQTQYVKLGRDASGAMQSIAIRPTTLDMQDLGTKAQITAQKQAIFNQLIKQGSTNLLNFGKNTQWAGRQLMVGFTLPLISLGTVATKTFMDMERQVIKFRKVYGDLFTPDSERQKALEDIQELATAFTKYGVAASDVVGIAADAAAAGFSGVDLQRQTEQSIRLSILGQIDYQKALDTTISLQNAFQISSEELAQSIDFLNAVENQTVVALDDVTTAIPKVAPIIKSLGGDVKDLAFFLAAMKEGGVNASEGANALKSGLASLINPTEKAASMLSSMGISIRQIVAQNQGDLRGTVLGFARALDTLDPLQRAQAIEQLFGKFQFARISTLFDNVIRDGNQASRVLDLATASVEELAGMAESELGMTAESAMNKFLKVVEDLKVALVPIGEVFLQTITPFVEGIGNVISKFNEMPEDVKKAITLIITLVGGLGPVALMTFGLIANGIANSIKFIALLRNGFLRLTGQSRLLGESTEYMTQEQLEAAAAAMSLDQAHAQLTQRFTAETSAVLKLRDAYQAAIVASNKFAAANPNAMMPGFTKPRKMQKGGIVMVPGSGKGDKVPAMLEPGEAVIPSEMTKRYAGLIDGMIAGNIPGFRRGRGSEGARGKSQFTIPMIGGSNFGAVGSSQSFLGIDIEDRMTVQFAYAEETLKQTGVSLNGIKKEVDAWRIKNKKLIERAVAAYERGVPLTEAFADVNAKFVKDIKQAQGPTQEFLDASERLYPQMKKDLQEAQKAVRKYKLDLSKGADTARLAELLPNNAAARLMATPTNMPGGQGGRRYQELSKARGAIVSTLGGAASFEGTGVPAALLSAQKQYDKALQQVVLTQEHVNKTREAEANLAKIKEQREKANTPKQKAAVEKKIKAAEEEVRTARRKAAAAKKSEAAAAKELEAATKDLQTAKRSEAARRGWETRRANQGASQSGNMQGTAAVAGRFANLGSSIQKASFAASAVAGTMSMFGGAVGEAAGVIFGLTSALFALTTISELLAGTKLKEMIVSKAKMRADAVGGLPALAGGGGIAGLFKNIGNALKFVLRFLGPVGIGLSVLAIAIPFIVNIFNQQKAKIEGVGKAARFTEEQLTSLAQRFNVTLRESTIGARTEGTTPTQQAEIVALSKDQQFLSDYKVPIDAIKGATRDLAQATLESLNIQLQAAGFGPEAAETILRGVAEAAGRKDIDLSFAKINLMTPENIGKINVAASNAMDQVKRAIIANGKGLGEAVQLSAATFANAFEALNIGLQVGEISAADFNKQLDEITRLLGSFEYPALLDEIIEKLELTDALKNVKEYKNLLALLAAEAAGVDTSSFVGAFELSEDPQATAEERRMAKKGMDALARSTANAAQNTEDLRNKTEETNQQIQESILLNEELEKAREGITRNIEDIQNSIAAYEILIANGWSAEDAFNAASNGAIALSVALAAVNGAASGLTLEEAIAQAKELIDATKAFDALKPSSGGGGASTKSIYQQATEDLIEQKKELENTRKAYARLRKEGFGVAEAFAAAKDPILAAALATTKVGTQKWRELVGLIRAVRLEALKTFEGQREAFLGLKDRAEEYFSILEQEVNLRYDRTIRRQTKEVERLEEAIAEVNEEIEEYQDQISAIQRSIQIEFDRPIAALQEEMSDLSNDLVLMDKAAEEINKRYDEQAEALEKVAKVNQQILNQQKQQQGIAAALSSGDVSAAASMIQDLRASNAQAAAVTQREMLDAARQSELGGLRSAGGMTREQILERQFEIGQEIYNLEEKKEVKLKEIQDLEDKIYEIQQSRLKPLTDSLDLAQKLLAETEKQRDAELEAIDLKRRAWEEAELALDLARIEAGEFNDVIDMTNDLLNISVGEIANFADYWKSLKDKVITLTIRTIREEVGGTGSGGSGSGGSGGSGSGGTTDPTPTQTPAPGITGTPGTGGGGGGGGPAVRFMAGGGIVKYMAGGGRPSSLGSDTVPAMLTPGEFVVNRNSTRRFGPLLESINSARGGMLSSLGSRASRAKQNGYAPKIFNSAVYQMPQRSYPNAQNPGPIYSSSIKRDEEIGAAQIDNSVYNYNLSVNVDGTNLDANEIANEVMGKLRRMESQKLRNQVIR